MSKHKCLVSKKLKKESERILERFKEKKFCSNECEVILGLAIMEIRKQTIVSCVMDDIMEGITQHTIQQDAEEAVNPMQGITGVGG